MRNRKQQYLSPAPFEAVSYGVYIQALIARDRDPGRNVVGTEDSAAQSARDRFENEGGRLAATLPLELPSNTDGEFTVIRRHARTAGREELVALAEFNGWGRVAATSNYVKAGQPVLAIPDILLAGDARGIIDAIAGEGARGGE